METAKSATEAIQDLEFVAGFLSEAFDARMPSFTPPDLPETRQQRLMKEYGLTKLAGLSVEAPQVPKLIHLPVAVCAWKRLVCGRVRRLAPCPRGFDGDRRVGNGSRGSWCWWRRWRRVCRTPSNEPRRSRSGASPCSSVSGTAEAGCMYGHSGTQPPGLCVCVCARIACL